jgi:hypothetical protein
LRAAVSGASSHSWRSVSSFSLVGQPTGALAPVPRRKALTAGLAWSSPAQKVQKML